MKLTDIYTRVRDRVRLAQEHLSDTSQQAGDMMRNVIDTFSDEWIEQAFSLARQKIAPSVDELPVDFQLRQSSMMRRIYERLFPVSHVFRVSAKYGREYLEEYMPINNSSYIGRGSYKFVYSLPYQMVLKISKEILPSDPIFGSQFRLVDAEQSRFLGPEEIELQNILSRGKKSYRQERIRFKFNRLGMERLHYWRVREALPDLVLPTKYFMGIRYRNKLFGEGHSEKMTVMDSQIMLMGKHLKEFAMAGKQSHQNRFWKQFSPRFDFVFDSGRFGRIKKKVLIKITEDFRRLIRFTEMLAVRDKLILDIHTENVIITLPDFELKIFDFHLFDEHLYEPSLKFNRPEKDHIEVIEKFIESLNLQQ